MSDFAEKLCTLDIRPDDRTHVRIVDSIICGRCKDKPCCFICPSNVFRCDQAGQIEAEYQMCIECGACKLACPKDNIELDYPRGGYGVAFHQG